MKTTTRYLLLLFVILTGNALQSQAQTQVDSIDYFEIKEATVCFDCINRNPIMLRQAIGNLEKLDSTKIHMASKNLYYSDLSFAYFLLTDNEINDYFKTAKEYAFRALHCAKTYRIYWQLAYIYYREKKCTEMEDALNQYIALFPKGQGIDTDELASMKGTCKQ